MRKENEQLQKILKAEAAARAKAEKVFQFRIVFLILDEFFLDCD